MISDEDAWKFIVGLQDLGDVVPAEMTLARKAEMDADPTLRKLIEGLG